MAEDHQLVLDVTVKRKSKRRAGFEVERREDGFYYVSKVPSGFRKIGIGDRVVEINGTTFLDFKHEKHANDLIDCFRLEVVPLDNDGNNSDDEEYEEFDRERSIRARGSTNSAAQAASSARNTNSGHRHNGSRDRNFDGSIDDENDDSEEDQSHGFRINGSENDDDEDDDDDDNRYGGGQNTDNDNDSEVDEKAWETARAQAEEQNQRGKRSNAEESVAKNVNGGRRNNESRERKNDISNGNESDENEEDRARGFRSGDDDDDDDDDDNDDDDDDNDDDDDDDDDDDHDDDDRYGHGHDADADGDNTDLADDYEVDEKARETARANAAKRNQRGKRTKAVDFDRPYISKYNPNDRFMITVAKEYADEDPGVQLIEFKSKRTTDIYVADVERGPFFKTALDRGDKILSINGKKHPKDLKSVEQARKLLCGKTKVTVFVMRPDPNGDEGYKWVMENT